MKIRDVIGPLADIPWDKVADYAPIVTATIAVLAAVVAVSSLIVQRNLTRKRAAIDFFLKTEMDDKLLAAYDNFNAAVVELKANPPIEEFCKPNNKPYKDICTYLTIQELFAVGIYNRIFDHRVCYHYWSIVIGDACREAAPVIDFVQKQQGEAKTFEQLMRLNKLWGSKPRRWQQWRDEFPPLTTVIAQLPARVRSGIARRQSPSPRASGTTRGPRQ